MNYIYALICPLSGAVRYVGQSSKPINRLNHHRHTEKHLDTRHGRWIRRLLQRGTRPQLRVLYAVAEDIDWGTAEQFFIASALSFGFRLTNISFGGHGAGKLPKTLVEQQIARLQDICAKPEVLAKRNASIKASWTDPETRSRTIAAMKAKAMTPDRRQQLIEAAKIPRSPEAKARQKEGVQRYFRERRERLAANSG